LFVTGNVPGRNEGELRRRMACHGAEDIGDGDEASNRMMRLGAFAAAVFEGYAP
jgi:hypothetical protein